MEKKPDRRCKNCRQPATGAHGLCRYHEVKAEWGPKWAALCRPSHPEARQQN